MTPEEKRLAACQANADQRHATIDEMLPFLTREMTAYMEASDAPAMVRASDDQRISLLLMLAAGGLADAYERKARRIAGE